MGIYSRILHPFLAPLDGMLTMMNCHKWLSAHIESAYSTQSSLPGNAPNHSCLLTIIRSDEIVMITVCPLNWEWYSQSQMPTFDCCQEGYRQTIHSYHYLIQESHKWWKNTASAHLSQWKAGSSKHSTPKWDAISDVCCLDEGRAMEDVILIRLFGGGIWWNCHLNLRCSQSIVTVPRWERPCAFIAAITTSWCVSYSLDFKNA